MGVDLAQFGARLNYFETKNVRKCMFFIALLPILNLLFTNA